MDSERMGSLPVILKAGSVLVWRLEGSVETSAEDAAWHMRVRATERGLEDYGSGPAGLGTTWWFDLVLCRDVSVDELIRSFGRAPDGIY